MVNNAVSGSSDASVEALLVEFYEYLDTRRGVRRATMEVYVRLVRKFFDTFGSRGHVDLGALTGPVVRDRVTELGGVLSPASLKIVATAMRGFLRFGWMSGLMGSDLSGAVGPVIVHRSTGLPRAISVEATRMLLTVPKRGTVSGDRDYAVLLMLVRFGLRSSEIAGLLIDDIDWDGAMFCVEVKGGSRARFPLPADVGEAIVEYLRVRPASRYRQVFLTVRGTIRPMSRGAVTQMVFRQAQRAGLGQVHAHRLRHAVLAVS